MDKLKPCPFCGGKVSLTYHSADNTFNFWHSGVNSCAAVDPICFDGEYVKSLKEAAEAWNRRATDEEALKSVARVLTKSDWNRRTRWTEVLIMGEHKYNPNCIKAKNGELPPKLPRQSKREFERELYNLIKAKLDEKTGGLISLLNAVPYDGRVTRSE